MQANKISFPSAWGRDLSLKHVTNDSSSVAVFFPGQNYSCELPLLYYTSHAALDAGHDLLLLEYGFQAARTPFEASAIDAVIQECSDSIRPIVERYEHIVFVGKSLGTLIAGNTADRFAPRPIRHLFLAPLRATVPVIEKYGGLVVSGTNDPHFQEEDRKQIAHLPGVDARFIQGADHALEVDDRGRSLAIVHALMEDAKRFFLARTGQ